LSEAYDEEELEGGEVRTVLRFLPALAPVQIAVLPLSGKLRQGAEAVYHDLIRHYRCEYDDRQSIGRRYRRQDEIGTPYCVTYDFESLEDQAVTIRERDSMKQIRLPMDRLVEYFKGKFDLP
jgi:glycyl-tRNA synthetase